MRRKYGDCIRKDGDCTACALVHYGLDCRNQPITKLEWARRAAGLGQKDLSAKSGVAVYLIKNVELGNSDAGNMTARNIIALAEALDVDPKDII